MSFQFVISRGPIILIDKFTQSTHVFLILWSVAISPFPLVEKKFIFEFQVILVKE